MLEALGWKREGTDDVDEALPTTNSKRIRRVIK